MPTAATDRIITSPFIFSFFPKFNITTVSIDAVRQGAVMLHLLRGIYYSFKLLLVS